MNRLLLLMMLAFACTDGVNTISGLNVTIQTPYEDQIITDPIVHFSWYPVSGADEYRLLLSDSTETLIVDTVLFSNSFKKRLENGVYLLQVHASNIVSTTASPHIKFTVSEGYLGEGENDLNGNPFHLISPQDGIILTDLLVRFGWTPLPNADKYTVKVAEFTSENETRLIIDSTTTKSQFQLYMAPGLYLWQVEASNAFNKRITNQVSFRIDTTTLKTDFTSFIDTISLFYPADSVIYNYGESVELGWVSSSDPMGYELLVAHPSFEKPVKVDAFSYAWPDHTFEPYVLDSGQYQWTVRSFKMNNKNTIYYSDYSEIRTFFVE